MKPVNVTTKIRYYFFLFGKKYLQLILILDPHLCLVNPHLYLVMDPKISVCE